PPPPWDREPGSTDAANRVVAPPSLTPSQTEFSIERSPMGNGLQELTSPLLDPSPFFRQNTPFDRRLLQNKMPCRWQGMRLDGNPTSSSIASLDAAQAKIPRRNAPF